MFAVPVLVIEEQDFEFFDGGLLRLNPELSGSGKLKHYSTLVSLGWHKIDFGFYAFTAKIETGKVFVFPGISIPGEKTKSKVPRTQDFPKQHFEAYVDQLLSREKKHQVRAEADVNMLIHDLRRLSASIYHAAEEARNAIFKDDIATTKLRLENVLAAQGMLKLRTDVLDFAGNVKTDLLPRDVPIFKKVDKVVRCFSPSAEARKLEISLIGNSFGRSQGPDVFELVPYILIDNAIKYSPAKASIRVNVWEEADCIKVMVGSIGPPIKDSEKNQVFEKGFRSDAAKNGGIGGSGIGLFLAKSIVEQFSGNIGVEVSDLPKASSNDNYSNIDFIVTVPKII